MKPEEIRELTDEELRKKVVDLKQELFNLRFQLATGQLDNVMRIRQVKRDMGRTQTILRERELAVEPAKGGRGVERGKKQA
ncbi:MAG: 50S ribosomal protein L29 [Clostridia bacterium]|nr:MAG: 50S ribosomal protein L29 [Clostridia bacterium]